MRRARKRSLVLLAASTALTAAVAATASAQSVLGLTVDLPALDLNIGLGANAPKPYSFAVLGDIPYGDAQIAHFPHVVDQINADPAVSTVVHLGDIKSGSSLCTDEYFASIRTQFDRFDDPMIYTPGDNEWTDCHRPNNGSYNSLERLAKVREVFFPNPNHTLGQHPMTLPSQNYRGLPENVLYTKAGVMFAVPHLVGSNNSLVPWTGNTAATPEQVAEEAARTEGDLDLIRATFAAARALHSKAVVLFTQADMFDITVADPKLSDYAAFQPIVRALAEESRRFGKPVYLFNGDSHVYNGDNPLAPGSKWLTFYGVPAPAANLTRATVDGSTGVDNYLRVTVTDNATDPVTWTKVPFTP